MSEYKPILLVEDDEVDVLTTQRAYKDLKINNPLHNVENGEEALKYLTNHENDKPCLLLLDLNMPKMGGIELLREIKKDDLLKLIPVVVLTTSDKEQDVVESYNLGVSGYMIKPVRYQNFLEIIKTIDVYWTLSEKVL